jgi:thiosulfate dehydrogenase [quinone] large subunit
VSTLMLDGTAAPSDPAAQRSKADTLRIAGLSLLSVRFSQGFTYWGGGSRPFIYAPSSIPTRRAG